MAALPPGLVFRIARDAGLKVPDHGTKRPICCPFHDDRHPSAFLDGTRNVFYCFVCTPSGGWPAKRLAETLGIPWPPSELRSGSFPAPRRRPTAPAFSAHDAVATWANALARARSDDDVDADRDVYGYLAQRGLADGWEESTFGILADDAQLAAPIAWWPSRGYRLVAPLFDEHGAVVNIQARAHGTAQRKTIFPAHSGVKGTLFASPLGRALLRGEWRGAPVAIYGEGLTDYLALSIAASVPVLAVPGAQFAQAGIGPWVAGLHIYLALDLDSAGDANTGTASDRAYRLGAERVLRLRWPDGVTDACDALRALGMKGFSQFLDEVVEGNRDA